MFVGRERELDRLDHTLDAAMSGRGGLRVLSGEPGIGKTRLADEIVARATTKGFYVSWGRAWETGGAPAYWPWIELLGPLTELDDNLPERVRALLTSSAGATLEEGTRADPARERFELFESVGSFVRACARKRPLLLVFDDLHVADVPSLELLLFVARGLRASRIAALGTYRDAEARRAPVADMLARITREGEAIPLRTLSSDEVAEIVRHETGHSDSALVAEVYQLTEGNPLFLREAIHAMNSSASGVPLDALRDITSLGGVLALVRSRLAGANEETRGVLEVASVLGRESELSLLAEVSAKKTGDVASALDEATARGLLVRRSEERWAFSHVLVREAFYRQLASDRRRAVHAAVANALEKRLQARPGMAEHRVAGEALMPTLAHHAMAALPLGDAIAAVRMACRAAAHARAQLAYEEAIALLERALSTCDEYHLSEHERAEVTLALGWASTEAGKLAQGRLLFRDAAELARRIADPLLFARAALGQGAEYVLAEIRTELVDVLREALEMLGARAGDEERRLRARVLARLAAAITPSGTPEEPLGLARQALAMAEGETDARTRIDVDLGVGAALIDFAPPSERVTVSERLLRGACDISDRVLELRALTRLACDYLELGDVARAEATIARRAALAEEIGHPRYQWQTPLLRSMYAMPHGRFEACEAHILGARSIAAQAPDPNAERCIEFHRFSMLLMAGRPEELRAQEPKAHKTLLSLLGNWVLDAWLGVLASAKTGDKVRAVTILRGMGSAQNTARMERATLMEAAVLAGAQETYERLYMSFDHDEDANTCWGPFAFACTPPIARILAATAFAMDRPDEAVSHCGRALDLANRMNADGHRAWVHLTWGEGTGDKDHLGRAMELAERLGMPEITDRARRAMENTSPARRPPSRAPSKSAAPRAAFSLRRHPERAEWTIEHAGHSFQLKDVRGLGMLAHLVDNPDREIHALDLASEADASTTEPVVDVGDAGEVIDARARDAYRQRINDLREELAEAESWRDTARATRVQNELDALTRQLAGALGLGGRQRRSGSAAERARITVQRRIREAIKKIAEKDADLGRHLNWTVRTGTFCAYEPEGRKSR